jgi:tRNA 2-selenouridine synthase
MQDLTTQPNRFRFVVLCGTTGSGKSRVLETIAAQGVQTLDLEALANHRGSVLGPIPNKPQPSQRHFETLLWSALQGLDPEKPVFVECESKKVGNVRVPEELMLAIRAGQCVVIDSPISQRVALLRRDYPHWESDFSGFADRMKALEAALGKDAVHTLLQKSASGHWDEVVQALLIDHYDPAYLKSIHRNFKAYESASTVALAGIDEQALEICAKGVVAAGQFA